MSILSDFTDLFTTDTSSQQTFDEAQANTARLKQQGIDTTNARLAAGTIDPALAANRLQYFNGVQLEDPGAAADTTFFETLTGTGSDQTSSGFGALFKDVLILAAIAGAIYLFVKLGGIQKIKNLAA